MGQTYPLPITPEMLAPANPNVGKPSYDDITDWTGGAPGDDIDTATATVSLMSAGQDAPVADYGPRHQAAKAALTGNTLAVSVTKDYGPFGDNATYRGDIEPRQPYPTTVPSP